MAGFALFLCAGKSPAINFIEHSIAESFGDTWSIYPIDVDGDGDMDAVASARVANRLSWFENNGTMQFTEHIISASVGGAMGIHAVDLDRDGDVDVVCVMEIADGISWWCNDGNQNFTEIPIGYWDGPNYCWVEDIGNDNDWDVLATSCEGILGRLGWFENDGSQGFTEHILVDGWDHANCVHAADINDDQDIDIFGTASYAGNILWFANDGQQNFSQDTLYTTWGRPNSVYVEDINDDGIEDILATICQLDQVLWFENDGEEQFTQQIMATNIGAPRSIRTADLDEDGDIDAAVCAMNDDRVYWFENDGNEVFTTHTVATYFDGASDLSLIDFDLDGDIDIVAAARDGNRLAWFENDLFMDVRTIDEIQIFDYGNGDGRADPGETCDLVVTISNHPNANSLTGVVGTLTCDDEAVNLLSYQYEFGDLPAGGSVTNASEPFSFSVSQTEPHWTDFILTLTYNEGEETFTLPLELGRPPILLIDDDMGDDYEDYYLTSLGELGIFVDEWNTYDATLVEEEALRYDVLLWETGSSQITLSGIEINILESYLDNGGRLLLSSTNAGEDIGTTAFYADYLKAEFIDGNLVNVFQSYGIDGCPFSCCNDSMYFIGGGSAGNYQSLDAIEPISPAAIAYQYAGGSEYPAGIYYSGDYKLVYLSFPMETVSSLLGSCCRGEMLDNILTWFDYVGIENTKTPIQPSDFKLKSVFPNPFNTQAAVEFELPNAQLCNVSIFNLVGSNVQTVYQGWMNAGQHHVTINGKNLTSGLYFIRLEAGNAKEVRKVLLLK